MFELKIIPKEAFKKLDLKKSGLKMQEDLYQFMDSLGYYIVSISKAKYLQGPRPEKLGTVTSRLHKSIDFVIDEQQGKMGMTVGTNVFYAKFHEQLERDYKIKKRPFLVPALRDALTKHPDEVLGDLEWRKAMKDKLLNMAKG